MYWVDKCSTQNYPFSFCGAPGGIRRCFNVAVPSAWIKRENVRWRYGEGYFERELCVDRKVELFEIGRRYKELVARLDIERAYNYIEYVPYDVIEAAVDDDNIDDNVTYLI